MYKLWNSLLTVYIKYSWNYLTWLYNFSVGIQVSSILKHHKIKIITKKSIYNNDEC